MKILTATIRGIDQIEFPKTISKSASSFIKKLCRCCKYNPQDTMNYNVEANDSFLVILWCFLRHKNHPPTILYYIIFPLFQPHCTQTERNNEEMVQVHWTQTAPQHHLLNDRIWLLIHSLFICVFLINFHHQGAIPRRDWAVGEMGPRTFRSTSKMTDLLHWRKTLRLVLGNMVL